MTNKSQMLCSQELLPIRDLRGALTLDDPAIKGQVFFFIRRAIKRGLIPLRNDLGFVEDTEAIKATARDKASESEQLDSEVAIPFGAYLNRSLDRLFVAREDVSAWASQQGITVPWRTNSSTSTPLKSEAQATERSRQTPAPRRTPKGGDALTSPIWDICFEMKEKGIEPTAGRVMPELKKLADKPGSPVVGDTAGGVKYEDSNGNQKELIPNQLRTRIQTWREKFFPKSIN